MAPSTPPWILILFILSISPPPSKSDDTALSETLLNFKNSLANADHLHNWETPVPQLCINSSSNWTGILCKGGSFTGLRLENMSLGGTLNFQLLSLLPLFSLSVINNNFSGPLPIEIKKLIRLRRLFLRNNSFSGEIPDHAFLGMNSLRQVELGDNMFVGRIPTSLIRAPLLHILNVENNRFEGRIPDFWQEGLQGNFSNNKLKGSIPGVLRYEDASMFAGNVRLCGLPLSPCSKPWYKKTAYIIAGGVIAALIILSLIIFLCCRIRARPKKDKKKANHIKNEETKDEIEQGKLSFVRNGIERFELEDLLRASAQVLGSGSFGSSYKAVLLTGESYVVRRFKHMTNVGKDEFYEHMRVLGRLSHPNLLPFVAFYYTKEEKLLVSDFASNGSLASHLHGNRGPNQASLDWPKRLRIIKGVARAMAHLHHQLDHLTLPHGHLKSSNVLLNSTFDPLVSDYALAPMINKDHAEQFMVGYKSPESMQKNRVTKKTDVWSLGVMILEVLTGRFPANYVKRGGGGGGDLASWVKGVVKEEWTGEVFDTEMGVGRNEGEMMRMLKIGMCCCEWSVGKRWELREAVERIEEVREKEGDEDCLSDGDVFYSSSAIID